MRNVGEGERNSGEGEKGPMSSECVRARVGRRSDCLGRIMSYQQTPSPFIQMPPGPPPATPTPAPRGRGTGAKRGRKPRGAFPNVSDTTRPQLQQPQTAPGTPTQSTPAPWATPAVPAATAAATAQSTTIVAAPTGAMVPPAPIADVSMENGGDGIVPSTEMTTVVGSTSAAGHTTGTTPKPEGGDEEGEDEMLPAMADDDYSAQLSWQSESKDNLKVLMDNFSPAQYDRFEAYRRHALPKQAVRRVIQQMTGQQVSQPVAQIIAGFGKVFVGEIIEKGTQSILIMSLYDP
ncbi:hypothetical protein ID866_4740 [Astraeus odoratus]|nr:hypothetical protein ID866_4740 [Astraeus odoratus]